ncbi:MAB_1171c family putative transporter [Kutzneria sp. 744]|uniref:MAB_1171c family putative transporter n=1 Tax=Kutzneria sp. (strain 744) TaxID=345341 RepID=UPI00350EB8F0
MRRHWSSFTSSTVAQHDHPQQRTVTRKGSLSLVFFWRFDPAVAWRRVRWVFAGYAAAIVVMAALFAISDVHIERQVDFITYYATQPTIAVFLLVFIVPTLVGNSVLVHQCWQGAKTADRADLPWLRRGLRCYAVAVCFPVACYLILLVVLVLDWFGLRQLDPLSTAAPAVGALGIFPALFGVVLPVWGPRRPVVRRWVRAWRIFFTLRPLHRTLRAVNDDAVTVAAGKALDPHHRVRRQLTELSEFRLGLEPYLDPAVRQAALRRGNDAGLPADETAAVAEAAQLRAAAETRLRGAAAPRPTTDAVDEPQDGSSLQAEYTWWMRVAKAYVE